MFLTWHSNEALAAVLPAGAFSWDADCPADGGRVLLYDVRGSIFWCRSKRENRCDRLAEHLDRRPLHSDLHRNWFFLEKLFSARLDIRLSCPSWSINIFLRFHLEQGRLFSTLESVRFSLVKAKRIR